MVVLGTKQEVIFLQEFVENLNLKSNISLSEYIVSTEVTGAFNRSILWYSQTLHSNFESLPKTFPLGASVNNKNEGPCALMRAEFAFD